MNFIKKYNNRRKLAKLNIKAIPLFNLSGQEFDAFVIDCYDADTITVVFYYNDGFYKFKVRLLGINSLELKNKDPELKKKAETARDYLKGLILDKYITLKCYKFDCFGRLLGNVFYDNIDINSLMVKEGHAVSFMSDI